MRTLIKDIIRLLEGGQSLALATIVQQRGSVPRESGARMVVGQDGSTAGTIGGGVLEAFICHEAMDVIQDRQNRWLELNLNSRTFDADMFCGGTVSILIEHIDAGEEACREFFRVIFNHLKYQTPIWLVTWLDSSAPGYETSRFLINDVGEIISRAGDMPAGMDSLLPQIQKVRTFSEFSDTGLLVEYLDNAKPAFIFGGGHIALKLVPLLDMVGFKTVVIDDRPEYANKKRFPAAGQIHVGEFPTVVPALEIDEHSYVVIITRGHTWDQQVLAQVLSSQAAYIGMIGSKSKRDAIYRSLREQGFTDRELERVFSPIGISIGAQGPAEIAVSIAAEMIKVSAAQRLVGGISV